MSWLLSLAITHGSMADVINLELIVREYFSIFDISVLIVIFEIGIRGRKF